jgi:hypothetical protein
LTFPRRSIDVTFRPRSSFLLLLLSALMLAGMQPLRAAAQDASWRVVQRTGIVVVSPNGDTSPGKALAIGSVIATGKNGRVILSRPGQQIVLQPNSRIELTPDAGGKTSLNQTVGAATFEVDRRKQPHFEVTTPFLAAVVKGTTFSINVLEGAAEINVLEGQVATRSIIGSAVKMLSQGMKARVTSTSPWQIDFLDKTGTWKSTSENEGSWNFRDDERGRNADSARETHVTLGGNGHDGGTRGGGPGGGSIDGGAWTSSSASQSSSAYPLRRAFEHDDPTDLISVRLAQNANWSLTRSVSNGFPTIGGSLGATAGVRDTSNTGNVQHQSTFLDREFRSGRTFFDRARGSLDADMPWSEIGYGILGLFGLFFTMSLLRGRGARSRKRHSSSDDRSDYY